MAIAQNAIRGFDQDAIDDFYAGHEECADDDSGLDEDEFRSLVASTKALLFEMQRANACVTTFAKTYGAFYTLWSVIGLHAGQLAPAPDELAARYSTFMEKVEELGAQAELEVFLRTQEAGAYTLAHRYFSNATGASTEEAQRAARHDALLTALGAGG